MRLLLGDGTLKPELREELESEGLVLVEEGLRGSVRYNHFKAPGKRFHGKVTPERFGLGLSRRRLAVYCKSGRVKLIDTPLDGPRLHAFEASRHNESALDLKIDYDKLGQKGISGQITLRLKSPNAARIADQLEARMARAA